MKVLLVFIFLNSVFTIPRRPKSLLIETDDGYEDIREEWGQDYSDTPVPGLRPAGTNHGDRHGKVPNSKIHGSKKPKRNNKSLSLPPPQPIEPPAGASAVDPIPAGPDGATTSGLAAPSPSVAPAVGGAPAVGDAKKQRGEELTQALESLSNGPSNRDAVGVGGVGCFGYETLVTTGSGEQKLMRDLRIGDQVVSDQTGSLTQFLGWLELNSKQKVKFLEIKTEDGEELVMTETHIVFYYEDGKPTPDYIRNLSPGNALVGGSGEGKVIQSMNSVEMTGFLAPLTQSGKIMSNNITASCYASFPHELCQIGTLPMKMFPQLLLDNQESQYEEGTRTYVRFAKWFARAIGLGCEKGEAEKKERGNEIYLYSFAAVMMAVMNMKRTVNME